MIGYEIYKIYFIPSSDFNAYPKQTKVILSAVKKYPIFFTSDEYDLYFFTVANRGCFNNLVLTFFQKKSGVHCSCQYAMEDRMSNKMHHTFTSLLSLCNANLHATSVRQQLQAAFLNREFLFIHSLKCTK